MKYISIYFFLLFSSAVIAQSTKQPNVVFIFIDDLRPDLGCYGNEVVISPNLDAFAEESALFTRQYVTVPTCGASRYSLLRGKLPRTKAELGNEIANVLSNPKVDKSDEPETFIEQLRRNGYYTVGIGKVSHAVDGYIYPYNAPKRSNRRELPNSWDEMLFNPGKWRHGWDAFFAYADGESRTTKKGEVLPYEAGLVDDTGYPDGLTAELAIDKIKELSQKNKPFFLGVGFFKPHLPFNAPKKYWDLYDENILPLSPSPDIPANVNLASLHGSGEFNQYKLGQEKASLDKSLSDEYSRKLIHGYYASISYVDAQVGKVISTLKKMGLYENTLIIVWGDHGWHLGDQRVWGKHTLFERSLQSVLIMKSPNMVKGKKIQQVVSSVDISPTILDFSNIPQMKETNGESMKGLITRKNDKKWRNTAYSYYRGGISVATPRYRFTHYFRNQEPVTELYDHKNDPYEKINIAAGKPKVIEKMMGVLEKGNTGLYDSK